MNMKNLGNKIKSTDKIKRKLSFNGKYYSLFNDIFLIILQFNDFFKFKVNNAL